jgi:FAD/FMN-containing dehydrogenase
MDAEQLRIEEDLRGQIAGDVHCDDLFVQMYASDASIFEVPPLGVARPRTSGDVSAIVRYAAGRGIPVFARGAGSGLAGDSLGRGLIIDFSRHLRRILAIDDASVSVQAGVVLAQLNERLARRGRQFGPDPAAEQTTTIGSVVALDASGSHWPAYGSARRYVRELEVVLADGQIVRLSCHQVPDPPVTREENIAAYLAAGVREITDHHRAAIDERRPRSLVNRSGYHLHDLQNDDGIDLARLLVGSEGTLALVTEAVLGTVPLPRHVANVLLFFTSLDNAAAAAAELSTQPLRACDLMDRRHLSLALDRHEFMIPADAEAVLLVEREGATAETARDASRNRRLSPTGSTSRPARKLRWTTTTTTSCGTSPAASCRRSTASAVPRAPLRSSKTSLSHPRNSPRSSAAPSKRSAHAKSPPRSSATPPTANCTSARSSTWPTTTMYKTSAASPKSLHGRVVLAARSAANMPKGAAARRSRAAAWPR